MMSPMGAEWSGTGTRHEGDAREQQRDLWGRGAAGRRRVRGRHTHGARARRTRLLGFVPVAAQDQRHEHQPDAEQDPRTLDDGVSEATHRALALAAAC